HPRIASSCIAHPSTWTRYCQVAPRCVSFDVAATTLIYTLSLHDALPILGLGGDLDMLRLAQVLLGNGADRMRQRGGEQHALTALDRKSTRLNSSHVKISYAVFCLKKKKK